LEPRDWSSSDCMLDRHHARENAATVTTTARTVAPRTTLSARSLDDVCRKRRSAERPRCSAVTQRFCLTCVGARRGSGGRGNVDDGSVDHHQMKTLSRGRSCNTDRARSSRERCRRSDGTRDGSANVPGGASTVDGDSERYQPPNRRRFLARRHFREAQLLLVQRAGPSPAQARLVRAT
jgi:hypothetical protein